MCRELFSEESPCGWNLVSDHLPSLLRSHIWGRHATIRHVTGRSVEWRCILGEAVILT